MIHYTVTIKVGSPLTDRFLTYMRSKHIPDVLATGRFRFAELAVSDEGDFRVTYTARNRKSLELYLEHDSGRMQAAFAAEFPYRARVSREVLEVIGHWEMS